LFFWSLAVLFREIAMRVSRWLIPALGLCWVLIPLGGTRAEGAKRAPEGPLVTIHAPHPEQFELALDEIELDWSGDPGAKQRAPGKGAAAIAGTTIRDSEDARVGLEVSGVTDRGDLLKKAAALKAANPGAEAYLVLYEPGLPKGKSTRRLLTREVGLLMEQGGDLGAVLTGLAAGAVRPVPGVPGGYVVEAGDPLAALDLAEAIRQRPGVRSAYPLLRRVHFSR
jgi:hypothetical protein